EPDAVSPSMADAEIICGLRAGKSCAWAALYDRYSGPIWQYVAKLVGSQQAIVSDLVQETMLAAARSAAGFDDSRGTLWQWLTGIAHHQVSGHWRKEKQVTRLRQLVTSNSGDGFSRAQPPSDISPSAGMEQRETAELVRAALARLPPDYASILIAKYVDEQSLAEIQDQWNATSDSVRSRMVRARQLFREVFERLTQTP
ncbi:MAG: sigma-70 family RNA polymerase sigma factor, partial [Planctomycetaceae bacterium]|nr:sigma-70 family RNA polymerase sigma factor [Planctomycetaceae bacterium]